LVVCQAIVTDFVQRSGPYMMLISSRGVILERLMVR
jgi:hypothetical protein